MSDTQNDQDASTDVTQGNDTGDTSTDATGDAGTTNDTSTNDTKGDDVVTRAEFDAVFRRMQAADKAKADAETKLREKEKAELSELERAKSDVEDLKKQNTDLLEQINTTALENAFFKDNKHTWHDPSDALRLLDMEGVEVKDGEVKGLAPAIEKLAKNKPHLLKSESDDKGDGGSGGNSSGASGSANNGKRKGDPGPKSDMSKRFPALKR